MRLKELRRALGGLSLPGKNQKIFKEPHKHSVSDKHTHAVLTNIIITCAADVPVRFLAFQQYFKKPFKKYMVHKNKRHNVLSFSALNRFL